MTFASALNNFCTQQQRRDTNSTDNNKMYLFAVAQSIYAKNFNEIEFPHGA